MRPIVFAASLVLLAGCSGGGNVDNTANAGDPTVVNAMPDLAANAMAAATASTPPAVTPTAIAAIPASFQGRWGMVANDCDRARADGAKGLMTVAGDRVSFYESRGTATHIRRLSPDRIAFDLPMSGEGMTWSEPTTLTMLGDGRTLVRTAAGTPDRKGSFPYHRCPA